MAAVFWTQARASSRGARAVLMLLELVLAALENQTAKNIPSKPSLGMLKPIGAVWHRLLFLDNM